MTAPLRLFISYSHRDEAACERMLVHLALLKRQGLIDAWHDRRIAAGADLDESISTELETADVVLCLVSADFLASNYCYTREMMRALERRKEGSCEVFPVIVGVCEWKHSPLGSLLVLPKDGLPVVKHAHEDDAWLQVAQAIRARIGDATSAPPSPSSRTQRTSVTPVLRSSNLSIRRDVTDAERYRFHRDGFEFIRRFFEESSAELGRRHPEIETHVQSVDAETFTVRAFRAGKSISGCRIYIGGMFGGKAISYSSNPDSGNNVSNEQINVEEDDGRLGFRSTGMASVRRGEQRLLAPQGAAELFWDMFMEPLQRR